ncbi:MAG TPA: folylpolyglutamate synthase/dihydrofolate synthase family protein [Anaerolineae bacterium]|nr:folylpolyglutamate synthase/dihydrofolate synthase family protein [Anaerolineae bacterium]
MLTYRDALRAIFQRTDYERQGQPPYSERVYRLARMEQLLERLGSPHRAFRSVHIAGTKGKGSTTAMIDSVLRAAGYRTGMYSSPHLHTFRERIRIEAELIPEEDVARVIEGMLPILESRPDVTVFEIITALAMRYYAERQVDFGVFEVGMGGRLDATNVLRPMVSVITSISLDHTKVLGDTIEAIAREKAGIIKPEIPVVTAPQRPEAMQVIQDTCASHDAPLTVAGLDWCWRFEGSDLSGQSLTVYTPGNEEAAEFPALWIPLLGAHQLENACTAVAAIDVLQRSGVSIGKDAVRRGLATVHWPGRMEVLGQAPLVVVDGAHNAYSVRRLLEAAGEYLSWRRIILIFGAGHTHSPEGQLALLLPAVDVTYVTQAKHAKATPAADLKLMADGLEHEAITVGSVREALKQGLHQATEDDLVLVTGSLFVVAEAREAWAEFRGLPPPPSDPPGVY